MRKSKLLIICIVMLAVGFAAVATTLYMTATAEISTNKEDFKVVFTSAVMPNGRAIIEETQYEGDTLTFETPKLSKVNDTIALNFNVQNQSNQYNADVSIKCYSYDDPSDNIGKYLNINGYFAGKDFILGKNNTVAFTDPVRFNTFEEKRGSLFISLAKGYIGDELSLHIKCELVANAAEKKSPYDFEPVEYAVIYTGSFAPVQYTTDYESLNRNIFVGVDEDNNQGICVLSSMGLKCFNPTDYDVAVSAVDEIFAPNSCEDNGSAYVCDDDDFHAYITDGPEVMVYTSDGMQGCDYDAMFGVSCE